MIQFSGAFRAIWISRCLFFISIALISACDNEEIIKPQEQTKATEPALPVREWYPAPKHTRQQPLVYAPAPTQQQPVMSAPAYQGSVAPQPWTVPAPQTVYGAPPIAYQPPPVTQYQPPEVWMTQQPVTATPQQAQPRYPSYQYQYDPRPWGSVNEPNSNQRSTQATETWPQGSYISPWGIPATGNPYNGSPVENTGQAPRTIYYGDGW
jgi:hypothetical protein